MQSYQESSRSPGGGGETRQDQDMFVMSCDSYVTHCFEGQQEFVAHFLKAETDVSERITGATTTRQINKKQIKKHVNK